MATISSRTKTKSLEQYLDCSYIFWAWFKLSTNSTHQSQKRNVSVERSNLKFPAKFKTIFHDTTNLISLIPWNREHLEKIKWIIRQSRNFLHCMRPNGSLVYSQMDSIHQVFPTKFLRAVLFPPMCATRPHPPYPP